jgi:hypothetical protein
MGRAGSMHRREEECIQDFEGKARRKETNVGGRIMSKWIVEKYGVAWSAFFWLRTSSMHGNAPCCFIKYRTFLSS